MNKIIPVIFLIVLSSFSFGQKKLKLKNDTIIWKQDYKLSKNEFKGHRLDKNASASTSSSLILYLKEIDSDLKIIVEAIFFKSHSCMKIDSKYTLKHEQIHFDIAELYARKLRASLSNTDFTQVKNMESLINKLYHKTQKEFVAEQEKYDNDTEHGLNSAKQALWEENIQEQINELSEYSSTVVNVKKN